MVHRSFMKFLESRLIRGCFSTIFLHLSVDGSPSVRLIFEVSNETRPRMLKDISSCAKAAWGVDVYWSTSSLSPISLYPSEPRWLSQWRASIITGLYEHSGQKIGHNKRATSLHDQTSIVQ